MKIQEGDEVTAAYYISWRANFRPTEEEKQNPLEIQAGAARGTQRH
jgi:hypothetical protein